MSNSVVVTPRPNVAVSGNRGGPQGVQGPQGLPGSLFAYVLPQTYDAVGDGVHDDTAAFNLALASSATPHVYAPAGTYKITGLSVPAHANLELGNGAVLLTSGAVNLGTRSRLLGRALLDTSAPPWNPNVIWAGAPGGTVLQVGVLDHATGALVDGVFVDGGGVAGVTGAQFGSVANARGTTWSEFRSLTAARVQNGLDFQSAQQCRFFGLQAYNPSAGLSSGWGLRFCGVPGAVVTGINFYDTHVSNFTDMLLSQGPGAYGLAFWGGYLVGLPKDGGCAVRCLDGNRLQLYGLQIDGPVGEFGNGTTRLVQLGSATSYPKNFLMDACDLSAATVHVEGFGWQKATFRDNQISVPSGGAAFLNTGTGPVRRYLHWQRNHIEGSGVEFSGSNPAPTTGFDSYWSPGLDPNVFGDRSQPTVLQGRSSDATPAANPGESTRLTPPGFRGWVDVFDNTNAYARIYVPGDGSAGVVHFDPGSLFSGTRWALTYHGGDNAYYLQNNTGGAFALTAVTTTAL